MELKGSKTEENLMFAMGGESLANAKYTMFSKQAKKDGYDQISDIFAETAANELAHAKIWYKTLNGGEMTDTLANLYGAAAGEREEWTNMYADFAKVAKEEGFDEIAARFELVGAIEKTHMQRYETLISRIENNEVFKRETIVAWQCDVCGHIHMGVEAPAVCPVCSHPQSHFFLRAENY